MIRGAGMVVSGEDHLQGQKKVSGGSKLIN